MFNYFKEIYFDEYLLHVINFAPKPIFMFTPEKIHDKTKTIPYTKLSLNINLLTFYFKSYYLGY